VLLNVNKRNQSLEKYEATKKHQENICIIFFTFLKLYLIRLQVVGEVVLIHRVYFRVKHSKLGKIQSFDENLGKDFSNQLNLISYIFGIKSIIHTKGKG
jgi:hypothetical protein